jgi:hypothetical protein
MSDPRVFAYPDQWSKGWRNMAILFSLFGALIALIVAAQALDAHEHSHDHTHSIAEGLATLAFVGFFALLTWRSALRYLRFRVVVDRDELRIGAALIPWPQLARLRERGAGIDVLDEERNPLARIPYGVEGVEDLVGEILRHRPELLRVADKPLPIGNVSVGPDRLAIATRIHPRSIALGELSEPRLRVWRGRLEVSVGWPGGGLEGGRLVIASPDPIKLWVALRAVIAGPAVPAV